MPRRALISVYDKEGVDEFARGLVELGWELVSSGGTASFLAEAGLPVTTVEAVTMAPEMLGGRVKTLHPRIHAGILARRDLDEDTEALEEQQIDLIDLVCVSLYPFALVAERPGASEAEIVEMIDVGGPSMLRAAAKNFAHVTVVSSPSHYEDVLAELRDHGDTRPETRRRARARGVRDVGRLRGGDLELVRRDRALPRTADAGAPARSPTSRTARTRTRRRRTTASSAPAGTCSRGSSSSAARSSRTTTWAISRGPGASPVS